MQILFLQDIQKVLSSHAQHYHMLKLKQGWMIGAFICIFLFNKKPNFGVLSPDMLLCTFGSIKILLRLP